MDRDINYLSEQTLKDVADLNDKDTLMIYQRAYVPANVPEDAAVVLTETMTTVTTANQHAGHKETMSLIFETVVTVITHTVVATPAPPSTTAETTTSSVATTSSSAHPSVTHTEKTTAAEPTASDTLSSSSSDAALMTGIMWCLDADRPHDVYTPCPYVHTAVPGMEQAPGMPAIAQKVQTSSASSSSSSCCKISSFLTDPVGTTTRYLSRSLTSVARQTGHTALRSLTYLAEKLHPELESLRQDVMMAEARLHHAWTALGAMPAHYAHAVIVKQEVDADVARSGWVFPDETSREDELAAEVGRLSGEVELLRAELDAVANVDGGDGGVGGEGMEERKALFNVQLELQVASLITELRVQRAKYDDCVGYKVWSDRTFIESQISGGQV